MSINSLVGGTGQGKSYSALELFILPAAKEGRPIVTNIPLTDKFREDFPGAEVYDIDMEAAKNDRRVFDEIPGGSLVLLDELWRIWPAGLKTNDIPEWQLSFIKEHRHRISLDGREMDIVFVTQNLADIASSIRTMTDVTIICLKRLEVGAKNRFRRDYYRGAVTGFTGTKGAFIKSDHSCKYKSDVYQYYRSHTKGNSLSGAINNEGVVDASIFGGLGFKLGLSALLLLVLVFVFAVRSTVRGVDRAVAKSAPAPSPLPVSSPPPPLPVVAPVATPVAAPPVAVKKPPNSQLFRLCGVMRNDGRVIRVLVCAASYSLPIDPASCSFDSGVDECFVEGERVSRFTGVRSVSLDRLPVSGLSSAADVAHPHPPHD